MMGIRSLLCVIFVAVAICGCTTVQKGAAVGAAGGAGVGAIVGHQSGHTGEGALIGAGAGALAGALIGDAIEQNKQEKVTKSCPKCGRRFNDPEMTHCPYDGTQLQILK